MHVRLNHRHRIKIIGLTNRKTKATLMVLCITHDAPTHLEAYCAAGQMQASESCIHYMEHRRFLIVPIKVQDLDRTAMRVLISFKNTDQDNNRHRPENTHCRNCSLKLRLPGLAKGGR